MNHSDTIFSQNKLKLERVELISEYIFKIVDKDKAILNEET